MPQTNEKPNRAPTDYRKSRLRQERRLVWLVLVVLVGGGTSLIGLIWGAGAAVQGGLCLLAAAILIGGLWLLLSLLQRWIGE